MKKCIIASIVEDESGSTPPSQETKCSVASEPSAKKHKRCHFDDDEGGDEFQDEHRYCAANGTFIIRL